MRFEAVVPCWPSFLLCVCLFTTACLFVCVVQSRLLPLVKRTSACTISTGPKQHRYSFAAVVWITRSLGYVPLAIVLTWLTSIRLLAVYIELGARRSKYKKIPTVGSGVFQECQLSLMRGHSSRAMRGASTVMRVVRVRENRLSNAWLEPSLSFLTLGMLLQAIIQTSAGLTQVATTTVQRDRLYTRPPARNPQIIVGMLPWKIAGMQELTVSGRDVSCSGLAAITIHCTCSPIGFKLLT